MFDQQLFSRICACDCSFEELARFVKDIDKKEFDVDCPFEKYYSLDSILKAIEKNKKGTINGKYLAYWMNVFNWIIMGGFKIEDDNPINLKVFLIWQICDWLDSLSFFDWGGEYDLEKYKETFKTLDEIYQHCADCDAVFAQYGYNDDDVVVLVTNTQSSYFVKVYGELDFVKDNVVIKQVDIDYIKNQTEHLSQIGYIEMVYGLCNDADFE